jgi:hypothetical protein
MKRKKIIGFAQLRNEMSRGNLENWFKCMEPCDHVYIFDQASTDDSEKLYRKYAHKTTVIYSETNRFKEELLCKKELFELLLKEQPDVDWVLWLDGDLLLDGRLLVNDNLQRLCSKLDDAGVDLPRFGHYNLWRSDVYYRIDNGYHNLHQHWFPLWGQPRTKYFVPKYGLHHGQVPEGTKRAAIVDVNVIHRGFVNDIDIINKYKHYKLLGQTGWDLDRLIDEQTLDVRQLPDNILPDWFKVKCNINPKHKQPLISIYEERS